MSGQRMKVLAARKSGGSIEIGVAFLSERHGGYDVQLYAYPCPDEQGQTRFYLRASEGVPPRGPSRLKMISPRRYTSRGEARTAWIEIGVALENERQGGYDAELCVLPMPDENGVCRVLLRPLDSEPRRQQADYGGAPRRDEAHTGAQPAGYGARDPGSDDLPF